MAIKILAENRNWYIYPLYIADQVTTGAIAKITGGLQLEKSFFLIVKGKASWFCEPSSVNKIGQYFFEKLKNDADFSKEVIDNIYNYSEKLSKYCRDFSQKNPSDLKDSELFGIYFEYVVHLTEVRVWGWVPVFLEGFLKSFLSEYLQKKLKIVLQEKNFEGKFANYYSILSSTEKMSEIQGEELARLEMLMDFEEDIDFNDPSKKFNKALEKHLNDFGWLTYEYSGPQMTREHLFVLMKDNLKRGNLIEQKNKIENHYQNIKKEKGELIAKLNLSEELKRLFQISADFMYIKDYRKGIYQKSYVVMDPVLQEIGKRIGLSLKEIKFMVLDEVEKALLFGEKEKYQKIVKQRLERCCYVAQNGVIKVYQGVEGERVIKNNLAEVADDLRQETNKLKGSIAFGGIVKGIAKIILIAEDVSKIKEGEILISQSTNPDLILAMKKAVAFVTETGGITSHASIVARELKKPCVVGVKGATKIIKDGDLVEVDANEGIVTIINE